MSGVRIVAKTSRESFQFMLRLPDDLRARIKSATDKSGRSMTAEILVALEEKFPAPIDEAELLKTFMGYLRQLEDAPPEKRAEIQALFEPVWKQFVGNLD